MMAKRTIQRALLTLAAGAMAQAALTGCGLHPGRASLQAESLPPLAVRVEMVKSSPLRASATFLGSIAPYVQTSVSPPVSGVVSSVLVRPGARVERGQLLAVLDTSLLQAQLAQAQANLGVARAQLYADTASAKNALSAAEASLQTAQAGMANAETQAKNSVAQAKSSAKTQSVQDASVQTQYRASVDAAESAVATAEAQFGAAQVNQRNAVAQAQSAVATAGANLNAARYALSQQITQAQNSVAAAQASLNAAEDQSNAQVAQAQSAFAAAQANLNAAQTAAAAQVAADNGDIAKLGDELSVLQKELSSVTSATYAPPLQISVDQTTIALNNATAQLSRDQYGSAVADAQAQLQSAQASLLAAQQAAPVGVAQAQLQQAESALQAAQNGQGANVAAVQLQQAQTALQAAQSAPTVQVARAQLQQAQTALQAARSAKSPQVQAAQLAQAQTAVKAAEAAAKTGIRVAQDQAAQAKAALQAAQSNPQAAVGLAQVRAAQAGVNTAGVELQETRVTAPISGYVAAVNAAPGQAAGPQAPIATLVSSSPVMATVSVPESQAADIRPQSTLSVRIPALGLTLPGRVLDVRPALNAATQSYPVDILLSIPRGGSTRILPGLSVQATLQTGGAKPSVYVPADSVLSLQSGAEEVFVVRRGAAYAQIVQVGAMGNTRYQITSGLKPGEQIVVAGQNLLSNGDAVRVVTGPPGPAPAKKGRKGRSE